MGFLVATVCDLKLFRLSRNKPLCFPDEMMDGVRLVYIHKYASVMLEIQHYVNVGDIPSVDIIFILVM